MRSAVRVGRRQPVDVRLLQKLTGERPRQETGGVMWEPVALGGDSRTRCGLACPLGAQLALFAKGCRAVVPRRLHVTWSVGGAVVLAVHGTSLLYLSLS